MRRLYVLGALAGLLFVALGLLSCKEEPFLEGFSPFLANKNIFRKDFELPLSMVRYADSVVTGGDSIVYLGRYRHPVYGETSSDARMRFLANPVVILSDKSSYDSIVFEFIVHSRYGKHPSMYNWQLYVLTDTLKFGEVLYSHTKKRAKQDTLVGAYRSMYQEPEEGGDTLRLKAESIWADNFFRRASIPLSGFRFFLNHPGFAVLSDMSNEVLLGIRRTSSRMILYYTEDATVAEEEQKKLRGVFSFELLGYSSYTHDATGTPLAALEHGVHTTPSEDLCYSNSGIGYFCALNLAPVIEFEKTLGKRLVIHSARLFIETQPEEANPSLDFEIPTMLLLSRPYEDPVDVRNHSLTFRRRRLSNDNRYTSNSREASFFNSTDETPLTFSGEVGTTLQAELATNHTSTYWLVGSSELGRLHHLVMPKKGFRMTLYYSHP